MQNQVGIVKDNPATRLADQIKEMNMSRGAPAGRMVGSPVTTMPRVRSHEMQTIPLSDEEYLERDRAALELGILSEDEVDPRALYDEDIPPMPKPIAPQNQHIPLDYPKLTARELVNSSPRFLDFNKIEGIDLREGKAYVDGFALDISEEDVKQFRKFILQLAVDFMTRKIAEAMVEIDPPKETVNEEESIEEIEAVTSEEV